MESGTENMDWIALVLRRIIEFTQAGGEINVVVNGINVGAQPYWNAEATMLMHTRGILVMMPDSAMVLTGKRALDYSGGVSAEDNQGIGGYERIMGPNGQAQYFARDIGEACQILLPPLRPHLRRARRALPAARGDRATRSDRDVRAYPYARRDGARLRDGRRRVHGREQPRAEEALRHPHRDAGGRRPGPPAARALVGLARRRDGGGLGRPPRRLAGLPARHRVASRCRGSAFVPADGPEQWTAGTLFPQSSRKVARAINAASGNRPVVVLANLSGFDGSPESMRQLAARVRRGDRPGGGQLPTGRSSSASSRATTAARSWSSRRRSTTTSR